MKRLRAMAVVTAVMMMGAGFAGAAVIQFPYVNSNPGNLSTIISVVNRAAPTDLCDPGDQLRLHYRYITKSVDAAHTDACDELNFDRPTTQYDIVTFDIGGNIGGGLALFNDATSYAAGVGNPNFDMPTLGTSEPRRGYVLVNHRCVNGGDRPTTDDPFLAMSLHGEAMLFDVVNGAAWNYIAKQRLDYSGITRDFFAWPFEDYGFVPQFDAFVPGRPPAFSPWIGGVGLGSPAEMLGENFPMPITIFPLSEMTTRMLVTPQFIASNVNTTADMTNVSGPGQKRTRIGLIGRGGGMGMTNRNEDAVSGGGPVHVRCVAGVDISEILGLAATAIYDEGGWADVLLTDPVPLTGVDTSIDDNYFHPAFVTKLEFGAPTWSAGSMINAARVVKTLPVVSPIGAAVCR